jgi:phosphopentomutase
MDGAVAALERVDEFLGGVVDALPGEVLLVIGSDHGNIEDVTAGHTHNPALALLYGPAAHERHAELGSQLDFAPAVLRWLAAV